MTDPLKRLATFQDLDAQRKADLKAMEEKKQAKATELFAPVVEAFTAMKEAGVKVRVGVLRSGSYSQITTLFQDFTAGSMNGTSITFSGDSYTPNRVLRIAIPAEGKVVFDDEPFQYEGKFSGAYYSGCPKTETHKFSNPEALLDFALDRLKDLLILPEKKGKKA